MHRCYPLVAVLVLSACGDGGSTNAATATTSASASAGAGADGGGTASSGGGTSDGGGGTSTGQGGAAGATSGGGEGGSPVVCDADGDGYLVQGPGCCGVVADPNAPKCDCDDSDKNVHPKQLTYFDVPRPSESDPTLKWDYDCDGMAKKEFPVAAKNCALLNCIGDTQEFLGDNGDYACGVVGNIITCTGLGTQCTAPPDILGCR